MKSFIIVTLVTTVSLFSNGNISYSSPYKPNTYSIQFTGSIVMEDEIIMLVDSGDQAEDIIQIDVKNPSQILVKQVMGCGNPSCSVNLGDLDPGTYDVTAYTSESRTITGTVLVR